MNQTPISSQPITPTPESRPTNTGKLKTIIIMIIVVLAIILGGFIGLRYYNQKQAKKIVADDALIIQLLFDIRSQATAHYEKNKSYQNWWPLSQTLETSKNLDTVIIYRKPDFQNYILYAYVPTHGKYFCIDNNAFADEVDQVTNEQTKCQE